MGPGSLEGAAGALRYWESRQQVAANNLANAETPGFKGQRAFARLMADLTVSSGSRVNLAAGPVRETGRALDVALPAGSFLVVETAGGERLLSGGSLSVDLEGRLVDGGGNAVLGDAGPLVLPKGDVEVAPDGVLSVGGAQVGRLRVEAVADAATLVAEAGTLFEAPAGRMEVAAEDRQIRSGFLEDSNVDPLSSLVDMLDIQRNYSAVQNTVRVLDDVLRTIANDVGRVG